MDKVECLHMSKRSILIASLGIILLVGFLWFGTARVSPATKGGTVPTASPSADLRVAYLAGGCFWCVEADMDELPGIVGTVSGYTGGRKTRPTYEEVSGGSTGHRETVEVTYDANVVSYRELVDYFISRIDPTDGGGQFVDRGKQYSPAIFAQTAEEDMLAREALDALSASGAFGVPLAVEMLPFERFWPAEEYHQDYYTENPVRYKFYRSQSGRDSRVKEVCELREKTVVPCTSVSSR